MRQPFQKLPNYVVPQSHPSSTLGDESHPVWVILTQRESDDGPARDLLRKILQAINIDLESQVFQIIVREDESFYLVNIIPTNSKIILVFGISPQTLGMAIKAKLYDNFILRGHQFIFSDKISLITNNADHKRSLWSSLQSINLHGALKKI